MEDTYGKILWEGYGLKYYGGTRTRTGLICKTDVGLRELKKARSRREDLLFAHEVKTCLYRNGFSALSLFYTAQDGQPFFAWDGNLYLLENPMPTKGLEEDNAEDFVAGAALMGQMHGAAAGLPGVCEDPQTHGAAGEVFPLGFAGHAPLWHFCASGIGSPESLG